jgi:hypothetical protein
VPRHYVLGPTSIHEVQTAWEGLLFVIKGLWPSKMAPTFKRQLDAVVFLNPLGFGEALSHTTFDGGVR